ncbi:MAG TPA: 50S ribosomal protein L29 [Candidatus Limnocylindria bacterium]|nr:50S ribosomal protein L29 [Candidatus Limnocylindria bacterium]
MKNKELKEEFNGLSAQEIKAKVDTLRQELFSYRLNATTAHIKDYSHFKKLRNRIARGLTYLRSQEASRAK